jgi:hypothetical protein
MARLKRIKYAEIEKLKQEVSLPDLVESYGVKLKKKGKNLVGKCCLNWKSSRTNKLNKPLNQRERRSS